jgi:hypothetical protein
MNLSGWNTRENERRGRGDFRITPGKCEEAQKDLDARKTGLGEGIKTLEEEEPAGHPGITCRCMTLPLRRGKRDQSRQSYSDKKNEKKRRKGGRQ